MYNSIYQRTIHRNTNVWNLICNRIHYLFSKNQLQLPNYRDIFLKQYHIIALFTKWGLSFLYFHNYSRHERFCSEFENFLVLTFIRYKRTDSQYIDWAELNFFKYKYFKGGQVAECGSHTELLELGGLYSNLWNTSTR